MIMKDLTSNFSLVGVYIFIASVLFKNSFHLDEQEKPILIKLRIGAVNGFIGILLLAFGIAIEPGKVVLDFRQIPIIVAAQFGGIWASILTGVFISLYRFIYSHQLDAATWSASLTTCLSALITGLIFKYMRNYWIKWLAAVFVGILIVSVRLAFMMGTASLDTLVYYWPLSLVGGMLTAGLVDYLIKANRNALKLKEEAFTDFLTELGNSRAFDNEFNLRLQKATSTSEPISLLLIDIDHFKRINDQYGHPYGDMIIREVGGMIRGVFNRSGTNLIFRIGGEEFGVILENCASSEARNWGEKLRKAVEHHSFQSKSSGDNAITVSVGIATFPDVDGVRLIESADEALYYSKKHGRNQITVYGESEAKK